MEVTLSNRYLAVVIDRRGNLASLRNLRTGREYIAGPGLDFWRIIYRHDDDRETPVRASQQEDAEVTSGEGSALVRYASLIDFQGRAVDVSLAWQLELRGEELVLVAELANKAAPPGQ